MKKPLIDANGEVRELEAEDLHMFKPAHEVLPQSLKKSLGVRGKQKSPVKKQISIRLSEDVLTAFKEAGPGWQTRIDNALKDWLAEHHTS
ncbi:BrnA antitoxin family protein [Bacterioplanoides sp.]|uniref:BrnA antitoxin family protein n=1 Tax=Bacterioplanoides sp. TaxID=2066072 RepID=UPI003AFFE4B8